MKKVLVTGDRGYIGSTLVPALLKKNINVTGFDTNFFTKVLGNPQTVKYKNITKDIREIEEKDCYGIDAIIHLSALSNDPMGDVNPKLTEEINYKSSVKLAKIAKKMKVKRFLFSSSCSIYGIAKEDTVSEESEVNPLTAYAKSKIDTEKELMGLADSDFCIGLLRNSTVYGYSPKFRDDLVVNNFAVNAVALKKITVLSDGTPWRPLIDVRDLSSIFIKFLEADAKKINANIFNIGFSENNFQVKKILSLVKKHVFGCKVLYTGEHGADTRSYKVSFNKFKKAFPEIKQKWNLEKSIIDLISVLVSVKFSTKDLSEKKYTRLAVLKKLIEEDKLNKSLYWVK